MGYYIFSYGIETDKIKAVFNSNDENTLELIKKTETFDNYKDFLPRGKKTTPEKALEDIIGNMPYDKKSNFAYGYALICICDALGKKLPYTQEIKLGYETDLIDECLLENFGINDLEVDGSLLFIDEPIPFDIPPRDDWPMINVLKKEKLVELNKRMEHIKISDEEVEELLDGDEEDEDKGCAYEHIKGIIENIKYCIKNNLEMINFCH
jgi:Ca2+-binding EF-hand superfamily protein